MATSNTASLKVTDLDFNSIKDNLKDFLKSQSEFTDYDFEGSGMSVLLDLLAYNTYYNGFYLNMVANEAFLDTAQVRKNILSHAKVINYIPKSAQGALAKLDFVVTPSTNESQSSDILTIKKYTNLIGRDINGTNYPFVTINANTAYKTNGSFAFTNVFVKQGEVITRTFPMLANNVNRSFEIPSANVDTTTLTVTVQESSTNTAKTEYFLADDLTEVKANSKVFFLDENENLNYTIKFGDNVLGQRPANSNLIIITYLDTVGRIANNVTDFRFTEVLGGVYSSNITIDVTQSSYAGTDKETIEEVRFRAPYAYTAQNRAVTKTDYEVLISKDFNNIEAVSVWGGEENDPVIYGKIFISIKTKGFYALSALEKDRIKNELIRSRNVMTVIPEIIDPEYCFVLVRGKVTYNPNLTTKTEAELIETIRQAIIKYNNDELNTFKSTLRKSKLQNYIDTAEPSITGSDVTVYLQKRLDVSPMEIKTYEVQFKAPLTKGSFSDKLYSFPAMTVFDNNGALRPVYVEESPTTINGINSIKITDTGNYYSNIPTVTITGDGTGATAVARVVNQKVVGIDIVNKGSEYTQATVAIISQTGDYGYGAAAVAIVDNDLANLRTYYYANTGEKVIVNTNVGNVDYRNGKITLDSFKVANVVINQIYANNVVTFNALPDSEIITPLRNRILTIDSNDGKSILLELVKET